MHFFLFHNAPLNHHVNVGPFNIIITHMILHVKQHWFMTLLDFCNYFSFENLTTNGKEYLIVCAHHVCRFFIVPPAGGLCMYRNIK